MCFSITSPHAVEFGIPILLVTLGHLKKDSKCIVSTMAMSMVLYTVVHFINLGINAYAQANSISYGGGIFQANYMFHLCPNNPLLDLFYSMIPYRYWYMYLVLPVVFVYLLIVYSPLFV